MLPPVLAGMIKDAPCPVLAGGLAGSPKASPLPGSAGRWQLADDYSGIQQLGQMYNDLDAMDTPVVRPKS